MHCSSCSTAVQKALSVTPGVDKASVSLTLEQAEVVYDPSIVKEVSQQPVHLADCESQVAPCPNNDAAYSMMPSCTMHHVWLYGSNASIANFKHFGCRKDGRLTYNVLCQAVLLEAIEDAGFEGELMQEADSNSITLQIEGMTCSSCSSAVETALRSQRGVVSAAVNLLAKRAEVIAAPINKNVHSTNPVC